jgi:hypothetical protein
MRSLRDPASESTLGRAKVSVTTRVRHGYGKTRGFSKTGSAGTGTVVDFGTPWHTVYPYRGIAGMHGYIVVR